MRSACFAAMAILNWQQRLSTRTFQKIHNLATVCTEANERFKYKRVLSYAQGTSSVPLAYVSIGQLLQQVADNYGDRDAVVFPQQGIRRTFYRLLQEADQMAASLVALNLKPGDRVGICATNVYEYALTQYAATRAGFVATHINPAYKSAELTYALNKVGVQVLIAGEKYRKEDCVGTLYKTIPELETAKGSTISSKTVPRLTNIIMISDQVREGTIRFKDFMEMHKPADVANIHNLQKNIQPEDPAFISYTSGTTGNPKAAVLSHFAVINDGKFIGRRLGFHEEVHRFCIPSPLFHNFASVSGCMSSLYYGATCVFPSPIFSGRESVKAIHHERCTAVQGTPTMYIDMLNLPEISSYDVSRMKTGIIGGAPCPEEVVNAVSSVLNAKNLLVMYGMTETAAVSTSNYRDDPISTRYSTVGFPLDHMEVKVVDSEDRVAPVNVPGELLTRGFNSMSEYFDDKKKTEEIMTSSGWLRSGDIATMDEYGYVRIVGRIKDMVIRGGENIYPKEIEDILHTHPSVLEAYIVGVPDKRLGEEVCAWVRLKPNCNVTETEMKDFCRDKMAYFKVPRYWLFKEDLPRTNSGKVMKYVMKEESVKQLCL